MTDLRETLIRAIADVETLADADPTVLDDARAALRLIASRSFARDRDLVALFDGLLEDSH